MTIKSKAIPHPDGESFMVPITGGKFARVDAGDVALVQGYTWNTIEGTSGTYARTTKQVRGVRKFMRMHRLIMDCPEGMVVDHLNFDTLDNRRSNLRVCTHIENVTRINPLKGPERDGDFVTFKKDPWRKKKWWARYGGKSLGYFATKEEARAAVALSLPPTQKAA